MDFSYFGETNQFRQPFFGQAVERRTQAQLDSFNSLRFEGGRVIGRADRPFDTRSANNTFGDPRAIFIMNEQGRIYASNERTPGEYHHSTLSGGNPVAAAGELSVKNGELKYVTAASGHYRPDAGHMLNLKLELERQGIFGVPIYDREGEGRNPPLFVTGQP